MVNGPLAIEMVIILFVKARKTLVVFDEVRNVLIEKKWNKDMASENFISTRFRYIFKLFRGAREQESC